MNGEKETRAEELCHFVSEHATSWYRDRLPKKDTPFSEFPPLSLESLAQTPYRERLYTNPSERHSLKIVSGQSPFLIARTHRDLKLEPYRIPGSTRPLVAMVERGETIEKGVYFYEHALLALLAHDISEVTVTAAKRYAVDSLIAHSRGAEFYLPLLSEIRSLVHVRILDTVFDIQKLRSLAPQHTLSLQVYRPEFGAIGESCPESLQNDELVFHTSENVLLETGTTTFATKLEQIPTPLIRYDIRMSTQHQRPRCTCAHVTESFTMESYA